MLSFFLGNIEVALSLMLSYFLAGGDHVLVCDPLAILSQIEISMEFWRKKKT
jgi:hypothetical protein